MNDLFNTRRTWEMTRFCVKSFRIDRIVELTSKTTSFKIRFTFDLFFLQHEERLRPRRISSSGPSEF